MRCELALLLLLATPVTAQDQDPFVVVLGIAQDAGLPHIGCKQEICEQARKDPTRRLRVSCLGIVTEGHVYLLDATPDLPSQAADLQAWRRAAVPPRLPVDGVFLTHGHIGHYLGLAYLGREGAGAKGVPVHGTARMESFLKGNGPWSQLFSLGNIEFRALQSGVALPGGVTVSAMPVPHRDEFSDTVGFLISGPHQKVLYLPDIDSWEAWDRKLEDVLDSVDVAFVDGSFYSNDELPGRDHSKIPHPRVQDTWERLSAEHRGKIRFIHLNHSNPLLVDDRGLPVASEGDRVSL